MKKAGERVDPTSNSGFPAEDEPGKTSRKKKKKKKARGGGVGQRMGKKQKKITVTILQLSFIEVPCLVMPIIRCRVLYKLVMPTSLLPRLDAKLCYL